MRQPLSEILRPGIAGNENPDPKETPPGVSWEIRARKMSERIIGQAFRAALTPCNNCPGDGACLSYLAVCRHLNTFGLYDDQRLAHMITGLTRCIRGHACRPVQKAEGSALGLSQDECIFVSLIAACQCGDENTARTCAFSLLSTEEGINCVLNNAMITARALREQGVKLDRQSIVNSLAILTPPAGNC